MEGQGLRKYSAEDLNLKNLDRNCSTTEIIQEDNEQDKYEEEENNVKCVYAMRIYLLFNMLFIVGDHVADIVLMTYLFQNNQQWFAAIYLAADIFPAIVIMWSKFQKENSWTALRFWCHPYNVVKWTLLSLKDEKHLETLKDIKAAHLAIEAPFQVLLKLSMVLLGILPVPGSQINYLENSLGIKVDFSWFSIVSSILSIAGMLNGAIWITEPLQNITDGWTAKIVFLPLFCYRMLAWLIIISFLDMFSFLVLGGLFILNSLVLLMSQHKLAVEPILQSILSLTFPVTSLPSANVESHASLKLLLWMTVTGNLYFLICLETLAGLYHLRLYNPWCSKIWDKFLIPESLMSYFHFCALALFASATWPVVIGFVLQKLSNQKLKNLVVRTTTLMSLSATLVILLIPVWGPEKYPIASIYNLPDSISADNGEWTAWNTEHDKTVRYRKCWDHTSMQYNPTLGEYDWGIFLSCGERCLNRAKTNQTLSGNDTLRCNTECLGLNCDSQYTKSDGSLTCAFYVNGPLTWYQAFQECKIYGSQLPTIMSDADNRNILRLKESKDALWLGISRTVRDRNIWESNNVPLNYTNWDIKANEPNDNRSKTSEDCAMMFVDSGEWHSFVCSEKLRSGKTLCEKKIERPESSINCNIEYTKSDGSYTCGFFVNGQMSWVQANNECDNYGATLPIIKSDSENQKILSVKSPKEWLWLGISRSKKNRKKWKSYNASLLYSNWDEEKPDDRNDTSKNCGVMVDSGKWHDFFCEEASKPNLKVLCEKKIENPQKAMTKLLIASGLGTDIEKNVEIINLNEENNCDDLPELRESATYGTGQLFNGSMPIICQCSCQLFQNGSWIFKDDKKDCRYNASSTILTNFGDKEVLLISGGSRENGKHLSITETFDGSYWANQDSEIEAVSGHCIVHINSSTIISIGGFNTSSPVKNTYFYNKKIDKWTPGPTLNIARVDLTCGVLLWRNPLSDDMEKVVVAAGGWSGDQNLKMWANSTELLYFNDIDIIEKQWTAGPELPSISYAAAMVEYNNTVILVGGGEDANQLYQLSSPKESWVQMKQTLKRKRAGHIAFLVPDEIVNCH